MRFTHLAYVFLLSVLSPLPVLGKYTLLQDYPISTFFNNFDFFSCGIPARPCDPTEGFVQYVDHASARLGGLIREGNGSGSVIIGTDSTTILDPCAAAPGRKSVRLESKQSYNHGLFIVDVKHMPAGVCGTWPAIWLLGSDAVWPAKGEIDIVEGVNTNSVNTMVLHTSPGCYVNGMDCASDAGCGIQDQTPGSFGTLFNTNHGGVFATEWTNSSIKTWFFPRSSPLVTDVLSDHPDPNAWGAPSGHFQAACGCDFDAHFKDLRIIINLTYCGKWAGNVFGDCERATGMRCNLYVAANPSAFADMYWEIKSLKVFQPKNGNTTNPNYELSSNPESEFNLRVQQAGSDGAELKK